MDETVKEFGSIDVVYYIVGQAMHVFFGFISLQKKDC